METVPKVVVNAIEAGDAVYPLPQGKPLDLGIAVEAHMAKQRNAGLTIVQDGTGRPEQYALGSGGAGSWTRVSFAKSVPANLRGAAVRCGKIKRSDEQVEK